MTYLLDTCVLSELLKPSPSKRVVNWLEAQPDTDLHVSVLTLGEFEKGIERLPASRKRDTLRAWLDEALPEWFGPRICPVDAAIALQWGRMDAQCAQAGTVLPVIDGLLAATAQAHGMTLVTRNQKDIEATGVPTIDPWKSAST